MLLNDNLQKMVEFTTENGLVETPIAESPIKSAFVFAAAATVDWATWLAMAASDWATSLAIATVDWETLLVDAASDWVTWLAMDVND
jgi:hypothetical protein